MKTLLLFPHNYDVEVGIDWPSAGQRVVRYRRKNTGSSKDGLMALISPRDGDSWYGLFEFGYGYPQSSGAYSTPDPSMLCVVACSDAFVVHAEDPNNWTIVPCPPIVDVRPVPEANLILFSHVTTISAYRANGILWKTEELAFDGLSIVSNDSRTLSGVTDPCPCHDEAPEFTVDLATGKHEGGQQCRSKT
jgi:hypothetical protein